MINQAPWFERTFSFDFPVGVFPCLVERLRGTPARIEELVRSWPADLLTTRVDGGWSIQEHVGHLWDLEALWEQRLKDFRSGADVLTAADLTNRKTFEAAHNAHSIEVIRKEFRNARHAFVLQLEAMNADDACRTSLHPRLKTPMRLVDGCFFIAEHDDHHIARMVNLARQIQKGT